MLSWANETLTGHCLANLTCNVAKTGEISSLSFGFSNGLVSPPATTYNEKATRQLNVPTTKHFCHVEFLCRLDHLYQVTFLSESNFPLAELIPTPPP